MSDNNLTLPELDIKYDADVIKSTSNEERDILCLLTTIWLDVIILIAGYGNSQDYILREIINSHKETAQYLPYWRLGEYKTSRIKPTISTNIHDHLMLGLFNEIINKLPIKSKHSEMLGLLNKPGIINKST